MDTPLATLLYVSLLLVSTSISCSKKEAQTTHATVLVEALATQSTRRLLAQPEVKKALEEQSQGATDEALDRLVRRGWKRLSDDQLVQRVILRRKMLSSTDVTHVRPSCVTRLPDHKPAPSWQHLMRSTLRSFFLSKKWRRWRRQKISSLRKWSCKTNSPRLSAHCLKPCHQSTPIISESYSPVIRHGPRMTTFAGQRKPFSMRYLPTRALSQYLGTRSRAVISNENSWEPGRHRP